MGVGHVDFGTEIHVAGTFGDVLSVVQEWGIRNYSVAWMVCHLLVFITDNISSHSLNALLCFVFVSLNDVARSSLFGISTRDVLSRKGSESNGFLLRIALTLLLYLDKVRFLGIFVSHKFTAQARVVVHPAALHIKKS